MYLQLLAVITGFVFLVWSADRFVYGAAAIARNLGVPPLIIGLTIVGFGTSAPEILISTLAAVQSNPALGVGNAIGSNIANIGLVIGATALIMPLSVTSATLRREFPVLFVIMLLVILLMLNEYLGRLDGVILLISLAIMVYWLIQLGIRSRRSDLMLVEYSGEVPERLSNLAALMWLLLGLGVMLLSSEGVVWGAVGLARALGVSNLVIGLTIVALGTSLPEMATSIMSAVKKEHDIAVGNILGSNMFNMLAVIGLPAVIHPFAIEPIVLERDIPVMVGMTVALFFASNGYGKPGRITRWKGFVLLAGFAAYQILLYVQRGS
ncbi:MAG: calcium/sodium antiporter [Acidiferrobacteraceae bacterium]|jgi:cation:H+ antiporter